MNIHVFRLHPGQDLRKEIEEYVKMNSIQAGIVLTCVGNLQKAVVRMADASIIKEWNESLEIVSLVGTMEVGNSHIHMSFSDKDGHVYGGHLKYRTIVGVTAEVAIGELSQYSFKRAFDEQTGYEELVVETTEKIDERE